MPIKKQYYIPKTKDIKRSKKVMVDLSEMTNEKLRLICFKKRVSRVELLTMIIDLYADMWRPDNPGIIYNNKRGRELQKDHSETFLNLLNRKFREI